MIKYRKFKKEERSSFQYWFWHWLAFNNTAREFGVWEFKYLLHDIEKPFLKLFLPYKKVQEFHRRNNKHHLQYKNPEKRDWVAMVIDWECSRLTKLNCPRNAFEESLKKYFDGSMSDSEYISFMKAYDYIFTQHKKYKKCLS